MSEDASQRVKEIIHILKGIYPGARTTLQYETPFQLLIATILAAQSTDALVNVVTKRLFKKYPGPSDFANADPAEMERDIHSTGFFRQKTRAIMEASQDIVSNYGGEIPDDLNALTKLRGVGRKTANVVLANAFGKPAIPVDTHVTRVSGRLHLTDPKYAERKLADKIEQDLMRIVPKEDWGIFSHLLIFLGRDVCTARNPQHDVCPILHLCPTGQSALAR